jgi:DNA repair protein RadA/Sms
VVNGLDFQRVAMLLAVVEKRLRVPLGDADVFLNVAGGLAVREPAADLGVVAAVLSSARNIAVEATWGFFGEVGLGGEVRRVVQGDRRLIELDRLGFTRAITARAAAGTGIAGTVDVVGLSTVTELGPLLAPGAAARQNAV